MNITRYDVHSKASRLTLAALVLASSVTATLVACGGGDSSPPGGTPPGSDASTMDSPASGDDGGAMDSPNNGDTSNTTSSVTFSYAPAWKGVVSVDVIGAFGQANDWKTPLLSLKDDGTGKFTGTTMLPNGQYLYLFKVTGDEAGKAPAAMYPHIALDPLDPAWQPCPMGSPAYSMMNNNPCSQVTVPQTTLPAGVHVKGTVTYDGQGKGGYLVRLDRSEKNIHHYFVNRTTSAADGTFDIVAAPGRYFVQVLYPTFESESDSMRDPLTLLAARRSLSRPFDLMADMTLNPAEVAYHDYAMMNPRAPDGGAALPTTFQYTIVAGASQATLDVYSGGASGTVGDPWYASAPASATSAVFDGTFTTPQKMEPQVKPGELYYWGTEEIDVAPDGGVTWTRQSMVFPITFQ